ncbi:MAG TPA: hypothetical protein VKQ32_11480 [Polyangia bacterium]|nr:hypothetical protein [Polyangia bacterium]
MRGLLEAVLVAVCALPFVIAARRAADRRRHQAAREAVLRVGEVPIGAVKDGEHVRIRGRASACEVLRTSPVSRRRCVGYRLTVEYRDAERIDGWQHAVDDDAFPPFLLVDDTGEAVVHAPLEIRLNPYRETSVEAASPALASLLTKGGVSASDVYGRKRNFRYVETILMPGDEIVAVGRATIEIDQAGRAASHREPPVLCHLRGANGLVVIAEA